MTGQTLARALHTKTMLDLPPWQWQQVRQAISTAHSLEDLPQHIRCLFESAAEEIERRSMLTFETKGEADGEVA